MLVRLLSSIRTGLKAAGLLPLIKRVLYAPERQQSKSRSTTGFRYRLKALIEQANFTSVTEVHDLPDIHAYWTGRYIVPKLERLGYSSFDDFFLKNLQRAFAESGDSPKRCISLGSGNCDFEVRLARLLVSQGTRDFVIECVDFNQAMLERGTERAAAQGVTEHIVAVRADFNDWKPINKYDVVIANMSLHHVINLEGLFDNIKDTMKRSGLFLTFDMVGRNGHMRWPEALEIVNEFWQEMPHAFKYNRMLAKHQVAYENFDCSNSGFEGIRAQDILPLLLQRFQFVSCIGFANIIEPFIDRAVGYNFDPNRVWDRNFIDRVHLRDEAEMAAGRVKPTHLLAAMSIALPERVEYVGTMTPEFCVRPVDAIAKI